MDIKVAQKLAATNMNGNSEVMARIRAVGSLPRKLDSAPPKYMTYRIDQEKMTPFGVYKDYRRFYTSLYNSSDPALCTIVFGDEKVRCSYRTLVMLKALTICGVCKAADRAKACKEIFGLIVSHRDNGRLIESEYVSALRETGDYYKDEIIRAIMDSVFTEDEKIDNAIKSSGADVNVSEIKEVLKCDTMEKYETKILDIYKKACKDPNFKVMRSKGKAYNALTYISKYFI